MAWCIFWRASLFVWPTTTFDILDLQSSFLDVSTNSISSPYIRISSSLGQWHTSKDQHVRMATNLKRLNLQTSCMTYWYIFVTSRSRWDIKVMGSKSSKKKPKKTVCWKAVLLPLFTNACHVYWTLNVGVIFCSCCLQSLRTEITSPYSCLCISYLKTILI